MAVYKSIDSHTPEALSGGSGGQWRQLDSVDITQDVRLYEWNTENVTDIYIEFTGIENVSTSLTSTMAVSVNDVRMMVADAPAYTNAYTNQTKHQWRKLVFDGMHWIPFGTKACLSKSTTYYDKVCSAEIPYALPDDIGTCKKLTIAGASPAYPIVRGNIKVWVKEVTQ